MLQSHKRQRLYVDSILEGYTRDFGNYVSILADSVEDPTVAQLNIHREIIFSGDPYHEVAQTMIEKLPITSPNPNWMDGFYGALVIPETAAWEERATSVIEGKVVCHQRTEYSSSGLNWEHLNRLKAQLPTGYQIRRIDHNFVHERGIDLDRSGFALMSVRQFLQHGIGYWVVKDDDVVCEAGSWVRCLKGIEIDIGTYPEHRGMGLATAACAALICECLERGLEPHWTTTSNPRSDALARKLGYVGDETYNVLAYTE